VGTDRVYSTCLVITIITGMFCTPMALLGGEMDRLRPFTVRDSIELSHIVGFSGSDESRTGPSPIFSPDRKWFLLITSRGMLSSNRTESTIWLFDRQAVSDYLSKKAFAKPSPKPIASVSATSNMPVLTDVRWLKDSRRIAFLGMNGSPYQQLFIADVESGEITTVTRRDAYVSAYDISGDTIAYTVVNTDTPTSESDDPWVSVRGRSLWSLLYPIPPKLEDIKLSELTYATTLHVISNGRELPALTLVGKPLKIFRPGWSAAPPLSLSPDGKFLITVAPSVNIPQRWSEYEPWDHVFMSRLKPEDKWTLADNNPYKPLQFLLVNLHTGQMSYLVDAPIGRNFGYIAPVKAFWLDDNRRAVLTNTLIPMDTAGDEMQANQRRVNPAVVAVDISNHTLQPIAFFHASAQNEEKHQRVTEISWSQSREEVTIKYSGANGENRPSESYRFRSGEWIATSTTPPEEKPKDTLELWVDESFDRSPTLLGRTKGEATASAIWNPNPQLGEIALGKVSLYHWKDKDGTIWSGLLALPPDYDDRRRYPLVIQTHSYDVNSYFADGVFSTGYAGRALTAREIVVLQMQDPDTKDRFTLKDGPSAVEGFESAIAQLTQDRLIDPHRVGVIGFSYTCFHTLYTLTHRPDLFAAATINDGNNWSYSQYILRSPDDPDKGSWQRVSEGMNGGVPWGGVSQLDAAVPGFQSR